MVNEKLMKDKEKKMDITFYRSLVGNILYLIVIRPNVMFAASLLSGFMNSPSHFHPRATEMVLDTRHYRVWN